MDRATASAALDWRTGSDVFTRPLTALIVTLACYGGVRVIEDVVHVIRRWLKG
jgi:hypothetical protein